MICDTTKYPTATILNGLNNIVRTKLWEIEERNYFSSMISSMFSLNLRPKFMFHLWFINVFISFYEFSWVFINNSIINTINEKSVVGSRHPHIYCIQSIYLGYRITNFVEIFSLISYTSFLLIAIDMRYVYTFGSLNEQIKNTKF